VPDATDGELRGRMQQLESILSDVEDHADPATKTRVREIVQSLMEFHGAAIEKIVTAMATDGNGGRAMLDRLARDELVSSALLLYGLHPLDIETRVKAALEKSRPYLHSHGGNVELLSIGEDGQVRLRMEGSCKGCPSSAMTMKSTIEKAIYEAAPDVTGIEVEGAVEPVTSKSETVFAGHSGHSGFALPVFKG
jgi:Fe-S cluster biogenesis protein NfuA